MTEPDGDPGENTYRLTLDASGAVAPGPGQTEDDLPAQDEE